MAKNKIRHNLATRGVPIHEFRVKLPKFGKAHKLMLMSDLHLLAKDTDESRIIEDLEEAKDEGARVLLNGDIFEAIKFGGGDRRASSGRLHDADHGVDATVNGWLKYAYDFLAPYADIIDLIGVGNHETALMRFNGVEIVQLLVEKLNASRTKSLPPIIYAGYEGVIRYIFSVGNKSTSFSFQIRFHHGGGGSAPVTKGMIDFNRMETWMHGADMLWIGHKHWCWASRGVNEFIPRRGSRTTFVETRNVMTAAYKDRGQEFDDNGAHVYDWPQEKNFVPQPQGGVMVHLKPREKRSRIEGGVKAESVVQCRCLI